MKTIDLHFIDTEGDVFAIRYVEGVVPRVTWGWVSIISVVNGNPPIGKFAQWPAAKRVNSFAGLLQVIVDMHWNDLRVAGEVPV